MSADGHSGGVRLALLSCVRLNFPHRVGVGLHTVCHCPGTWTYRSNVRCQQLLLCQRALDSGHSRPDEGQICIGRSRDRVAYRAARPRSGDGRCRTCVRISLVVLASKRVASWSAPSARRLAPGSRRSRALSGARAARRTSSAQSGDATLIGVSVTCVRRQLGRRRAGLRCDGSSAGASSSAVQGRAGLPGVGALLVMMSPSDLAGDREQGALLWARRRCRSRGWRSRRRSARASAARAWCRSPRRSTR